MGSIHTLGALHDGHAELIRLSSRENEITIVTVYPNRIQLFPGIKYKFDLDEDVALARASGADIVISSTDEEMFPPDFVTFLDQGDLHHRLNSEVFSFASRGQVTGSLRWINFTRPTRSYFGRKDIEQAVLVGRAVKDLLIDCEIRCVPCVRFQNGVPISSRLKDVAPSRLQELSGVYHAMLRSVESISRGTTDRETIVENLRAELNQVLSGFKIKYVTVVSAITFNPIDPIEIPFVVHVCVSDGVLTHFDGQWIRNNNELMNGQEVIWLPA
jgi:pantoate--beta-alanine ligase